MLVVLVALAIATMAVAAREYAGGVDKTYHGNSTTIEKTYELHADSGLPGYEHLDWSQVEALARGTELNFYLWSPVDTAPRRWIDEVLSPGLHDKYVPAARCRSHRPPLTPPPPPLSFPQVRHHRQPHRRRVRRVRPVRHGAVVRRA
jgi:hypothetical protein